MKNKCIKLDGNGFGPFGPRSPACTQCDGFWCGQTPTFKGCEPTPTVIDSLETTGLWSNVGTPPFVVRQRVVVGSKIFTCGCGCAVADPPKLGPRQGVDPGGIA